jgi:hypothetical protein
MDVIDIIREAIKNHPIADGLCSDGCGCGIDDLAPCCGGPYSDCQLAKSRILEDSEYFDECGPGDIWYEEILKEHP